MSLSEVLKSFFKSKNKEVPESYCPNCWGRQEYSGKLYDAVLNEGIHAGNLSEKVGWIEAYAQEHLSLIKLKKTEDHELVCSSCKVSYKPTDS